MRQRWRSGNIDPASSAIWEIGMRNYKLITSRHLSATGKLWFNSIQFSIQIKFIAIPIEIRQTHKYRQLHENRYIGHKRFGMNELRSKGSKKPDWD